MMIEDDDIDPVPAKVVNFRGGRCAAVDGNQKLRLVLPKTSIQAFPI
jgi:hypothetical protein